jgi:GNAT superfamily N-acetyltransferase
MFVTPLALEDLHDAYSFFQVVFPEDLKRNEVEDVALSIDGKFRPVWKTYAARDADGRFIGLTGLYEDGKEAAGEVAWLSWFGIMPEFRNKGYGTELLQWTMEQAVNLGYVYLKIYTYSNHGDACRLYEKNGFHLYKTLGSKLFFQKRLIVSRPHVNNEHALANG